jgi:uncharacterized protein (TIGR03435 family)
MFGNFPLKASAAMALTLGAAFAQTAASGPTFEVASIKPSTLTPAAAMAAGRNVGAKIDAARVDIGLASVALLIRMAYNVKPYQLSGPDWMATERFDVVAKLPEGSAKDQVPQMLQALLAERFKLAVRRESKVQTVYALVVGKDGPRLKETPPNAPTSDKPFPNGNGGRRLVQVQQSEDGPRTFAVLNGVMLFEAEKIAMPDLAFTLMPYVDGTPVVDMTGLKGYYQVAMPVPGTPNSGRMAARGGMGTGVGDAGRAADAAADPAGSIFASVQKLGLKLEKRQAPIEYIVVEHLEKVPTEN